MNKEIAKKAFDSAKKEVEDTQIEKLKEVIKQTLQRIDEIDKYIKELQEERKILKLDIDDLKEGRLDRIEERQEKDKKAQKTSVAKIRKVVEHHHHYDRWYQPYTVTWITPRPHWNPTEVFCLGSSGTALISSDCNTVTSSTGADNTVTADATGSTALVGGAFTLTNSVAHDHSIGTYAVGCKTIHLR